MSDCNEKQSKKIVQSPTGENPTDNINISACKECKKETPKKVWSFAKKCCSLKGAALLLSFISVIHVAYFGFYGGKYLNEVYTEALEDAEELPLPPDMQDLSLNDVMQVAKDIEIKNWEKYNEQLLEEVATTALGHTNYCQETYLSIKTVHSIESGADTCSMAVRVIKDRYGDVCKGVVRFTMGYPYLDVYEADPFMEYEFYQVLGEESFDLYFKYAGEWYYKNISNEVQTILNDSPDVYFKTFSENVSLRAPVKWGAVYSNIDTVRNIYPFSLYSSKACDGDSDFWAYLSLDYGERIEGVNTNAFGDGLVIAEWKSLAKQGDSAIESFLGTAMSGATSVKFSNYGEITEIVLPAETAQSKPFSDELKKQLCDDVLAFEAKHFVEWEERALNGYKNKN